MREWNEIKRLIRNLKHTDNTEIIISFLKNHMIRSELASAHADLVDILKTKNAVCHLEDLFVACKDNTMFTQSLEKYLIVHVKHPS